MTGRFIKAVWLGRPADTSRYPGSLPVVAALARPGAESYLRHLLDPDPPA